MPTTRVDLPAEKREPAIKLLNEQLANLIDLQLQTKQAHWNVKGPTFIALHELFDDIAEELEEYVDTVAERATALGGIAEGTVAAISKKTSLPAYPLTISAGRDHVEALSSAFATVAKSVRKAIDQSTELGDAGTADVFTEVSRGLDKQLWFIESHLQ
jgi:starvation-inducible DNA-binding protein